GACGLDRAGRTVEQARPDRGAQGDEVQVTGLQTGPATGRRGGGGGLRAGAHRGVVLRRRDGGRLLVPLTRYGGCGQGEQASSRNSHAGRRAGPNGRNTAQASTSSSPAGLLGVSRRRDEGDLRDDL